MDDTQNRLESGTAPTAATIGTALAQQYDGDGRLPHRITLRRAPGGDYVGRVHSRDDPIPEALYLSMTSDEQP